MQAFTLTQWAILALVFVAGWLLGLASHSGGRKWRDRYAAEREAHAAARRDADARVAAAETRARDLEQDHARLRSAERVTIAPRRPIVTSAVARPTVQPGAPRRGWFDWDDRVLP